MKKPTRRSTHPGRRPGRFLTLGCAALLVALALPSDLLAAKKKRGKKKTQERITAPLQEDEMQVVDCLLPGQVRKLGRTATYVTPRRPVRTTARDCAIRGGEWVAYDRANYATALKVWLASAESGDARAQYYVGEIYEKGLGREPDPAQAANWYRKAAEQGYSPAQINLGFLYEKGLGVPQDPQEAMRWYREGAGAEGTILLDSDIEAIDRQLADADRALQEARATTDELRRELQSAQTELSRTESTQAEERERLAGEKARLEQRVAQLETDLAEQEETVTRLAENRPKVGFAGPTIEIIQPGATRSARNTAATELVGRVDAPAGVDRFEVNRELGRLDEDGFFRIPLEDRDEFRLVAIDRQGKRDERLFRLDDEAPQIERPPRRVEFGEYHALVIGNSNYGSFPDLQTAGADAQAIADVLRQRYEFEVTLLNDARKIDVLRALFELRERLGKDDNLLVYYAGHGEFDTNSSLGYWLMSDATTNVGEGWLSSKQLSDMIGVIDAKHVLVMADSCYSGALTRSSIPRFEGAPDERTRWLRYAVENRSRTALTSGGLRPVLDAGGGGHSVFARAVLDALQSNTRVLETHRLWSSVRARVEHATRKLDQRQEPEYAPLRHAGHESGEFFFVPKRG